jgi:hypothetical protein
MNTEKHLKLKKAELLYHIGLGKIKLQGKWAAFFTFKFKLAPF